MVTIDNEELRGTYHYLITIENIIHKEIRHVNGNKSHLDKLVPNYLSGVYSSKEKTALAFIDNISRTSYENAILSLVSTFERVVFAKYRTSYGKLKSVVVQNTTKPLDYYKSRERFIYGKIDKLAEIISLIEGTIDNLLLAKLKKIKDHRNYISHGKRDSQPPAVEYSIDEIAQTMDDIIREIEK